ncbi:MAG TPA: hypothetical protein VFQ35_13375, partial [Polyangiaceae bacterium]|nr:hypothetical protein [Polyangiaceae bacterium]
KRGWGGLMNTTNDSIDDIAAITPTPGVKLAGGLTILSGFISGVLALQAGTLLGARGVYRLSEPLFALLGLACLVSGFRLTRMRAGSARWATVAAALACVSGLVWFVMTLQAGVFVLMALGLVPLASIATIAGLASLKPVERAAAARRRLREQGLDSGL